MKYDIEPASARFQALAGLFCALCHISADLRHSRSEIQQKPPRQ